MIPQSEYYVAIFCIRHEWYSNVFIHLGTCTRINKERDPLKTTLFNYLLTDQRYNYIIILLLALENTICFPFQVNIFNTTTTNSPKADGLNAMQSWVICCIFFVFGALFEYAIILLQMKIKTFRKLAASMQKDETCAMDVAVLIAFPIVFLIFNIVYWAAFHL